MSANPILRFFRDCHKNYLATLRELVPQFPPDYRYPSGNPVQPVLPISDSPKNIMLIGAFPSARFEMRDDQLIPVADNLSPFASETYFDGRGIRAQASREILDRHYFPQLGLEPAKLWITDLVKVYLFPKDHIENCSAINPEISYTNTHTLFPQLAEVSYVWLEKEIELCRPQVIITLGEVVARIISQDKVMPNKQLLNGELHPKTIGTVETQIAHLGHPEIWRRNANGWRAHTEQAIHNLATQLM